MTESSFDNLHLLAADAHRFLQTNFEVIQKHCFEVYQSAFVWVPKKSLMRRVYATEVHGAPEVTVGLPDSRGPMELVIQTESPVYGVALSPDGSRIVVGTEDGKVRVVNALTGETEAEPSGHTDWVNSVAFS